MKVFFLSSILLVEKTLFFFLNKFFNFKNKERYFKNKKVSLNKERYLKYKKILKNKKFLKIKI